MLKRIRSGALFALAIAAGSCADQGTVSPELIAKPLFSHASGHPEVRFSELHYDNASFDVDEAIEISGPAGTLLDGWKVLLYNGNGGAVYGTRTLSGSIPSTCGARGVVVLTYPADGIQNGSPDGMALVDAGGSVVEFLSYEGTFIAVGDAANGIASVDIGVTEGTTTPVGHSLQRDASGAWSAPAANTFGACNDDDGTPPAEVDRVSIAPASSTIVVGGTQVFTATAFDAGDAVIPGAALTWSSTDPAIATVDASGIATGIAEGDAQIVATAGNGVAGTATIHVDPAPPPPPGELRIAELHYDNVGIDSGEGFEIEGPAGTSLAGWSVVLYNGNGGASYATVPLAGTLPASCGQRGVLSFSAVLQNGSPDGLALVSPGGTVIEFLSYEGAFAATSGPANGIVSTDIGVSEAPDNTVPAGQSLQRDADGAWYGPAPASFGACNTPPLPPPPPSIVINELMADPLQAAGGATWGEWFEVHNVTAGAIDLQGWTIASAGGAGQPDHVIASSVVVPAGGYAVLGRGADLALNGGVTLDYNYFSGGSSTIFLDGTDHLVLRNPAGETVDSVRWAVATTVVRGVTRALHDASADNANVDGAGWGYSTATFGDGDYGTPGAANGTLSATPPAVPNSIVFSGRLASEPALPVGFEDQIFATLRDGSGVTIPTTFTWTSETPAIAAIDQLGVMRALAAGTAVLRATAADGTTRTHTLPTIVATASATAQYAGNAEFGEPADGTPADDFIIRYPQFTASYNPVRNIPNWVSYNLEASQFGPEDRCDCFTFDQTLPVSFARYTTADYTGAGAFHGYGIDRGHLARSFDRTSGSLDNARTYYFTNIIPQAADNNQGPWAIFENYLGDLARLQNREVYIVAGASGSKGTIKNENTITIPAHTWKVALVLPRNEGLGHVDSHDDFLEVIAVIMPNDPGIRNVGWETYRTTVDAVEALSGYDLFALLRDDIETAIESNTKPPVAALDGPYSGSLPGETIPMSAAASSDPDGHALTYQWTFGDGQSATGVTASHAYTQGGTYPIRLIVTDVLGLADTVGTTATVLTPAQAIQNAITMVSALRSAGTLAAADANSLATVLDAGLKKLERSQVPPALEKLHSFVATLDAIVAGGRLSEADAGALRTLVNRVIDSIS